MSNPTNVGFFFLVFSFLSTSITHLEMGELVAHAQVEVVVSLWSQRRRSKLFQELRGCFQGFAKIFFVLCRRARERFEEKKKRTRSGCEVRNETLFSSKRKGSSRRTSAFFISYAHRLAFVVASASAASDPIAPVRSIKRNVPRAYDRIETRQI